ncbi:MAG: hypothetical protein MPJ50_01985 [Pirellulales bacterium]|nr:hypothetical protein [Pirellulales bacterium]
MDIGIFLVVFVAVLVIVVLLVAAILSASIHTYNKFASKRASSGPPPQLAGFGDIPQPSTSAPPVASANPYQAPASSLTMQQQAEFGGSKVLVRQPSFGLAVGIVVLRSLVNNIAGFILGFVYGMLVPQAGQALAGNQDPVATIRALWTSEIGLTVASLLVSFFLGALVLKVLLSTSYGKAMIVQLIEFFVYLVIGLMIFVIVFALTAGTLRI